MSKSTTKGKVSMETPKATKPVVEIIPSTSLNGIETSISEIENAKHRFTMELKPMAEAIVVNSPASFLEAGTLLKQIRDVKKIGGVSVQKWKDLLKRGQDYIKNTITAFETFIDPTETALQNKMTDWQAEDRRLTELEQKRINQERQKQAQEKADADRKQALLDAEENRKRRVAEIKSDMKRGAIGKREGANLLKAVGEMAEADKLQAEADAEAVKSAPVAAQKVLPSTPAVAGLQRRTNWKFVVIDGTKVPREFLMPNEVEIGRMVRGMQGQMPETATREEVKAAAEAKCPGITVEWKDSI